MTGFRSMSNIDGHIAATDEARVPVLDRGFLYGDSIYEVFRTYQGVPLFFDEHWARFENSARLIGMRIGFSRQDIWSEIRRTIAATGAPSAGQDVYVRFIVTRGQGDLDLYPDETLEPRLVVIVKEAPAWSAELYSRGLALAIVSTRRNPARALDPNIKGGNYLNNVLGVLEARSLGADDCLMLSDAGLLTEASNSNVFFVIDGEIATPSQSAANLRGLTKAAVHAACRARGLATTEREIAPADASRASECFVTSATREVMPVATLRFEDGSVRAFPEGGGPITRQTAGYYRDHVAAYVRDHGHLSLF